MEEALETERTMKQVSVLIVDDHPVYRLGLRTLLQSESRSVVIAEADSGPAAIEKAAKLQPDVVVMDVSLPGMNGFLVADQIRRRSSRTAIVFVSVHRDPELIREAFSVGATAYIPKDDAPSRLLNSIREALPLTRAPVAESAPARRPPWITMALDRLTPRERQVMAMIADGLSNKDIARHLDLSVRTVEVHRKNLLQKLQLRSTADLIRRAMQFGVMEY